MLISSVKAQVTKVNFGAFYFDGWSGYYPYHITKSLTNDYDERKPKWGWITSSQKIMDAQIIDASDAGLSFFAFCWYSNGKSFKNEALNRSFYFYKSSPFSNRLKFCLLVVNHDGFDVGPPNWETLTDEWVTQLRDPRSLKENGKPVIIFYNFSRLIAQFGGVDGASKALEILRSKARLRGVGGISIAACIEPDRSSILQAEDCNLDFLTGYNYHAAGYTQAKGPSNIKSLQEGEYYVWSKIAKNTALPYMPVVTLNWDPRPWANNKNNYNERPFYLGYSPQSVYSSVMNCREWVGINSGTVGKTPLAFLYAWNEYGEGAFLTTTKRGENFLSGLKKALTDKIK